MPARPLPNHPGGATSPTPPGSDHALPDEYDVDLLARAPEVTQEQRQAGYDTGLLSSAAHGRQAQPTPHPPEPGNDPPTSPRYGGYGPGAPLPGHGGRASSTEKFDPASAGHYLSGGGDERAVYSPIGDRRRETYETQNGNRMSQLGGPGMGQGAMAAAVMGATPSDDYEKPLRGRANGGAGGYGGRGGAGRTAWRPWYRRPTGLALIIAAIALLIVVIVVPIAVTQTKSSSNADTNPGSSGSFSLIPSSSSSSPLAGEGPTVSSNGGGPGHSTSSPTALASAGSGVNSSTSPVPGQGGVTHEGGEGGGPISLRALPTLAPR